MENHHQPNIKGSNQVKLIDQDLEMVLQKEEEYYKINSMKFKNKLNLHLQHLYQ